MTTAVPDLRQDHSVSTMMLVGWQRAWAFTGILRRDTRTQYEASKTWTWQWAVVAVQAAILFPIRLCYTAATIDQTWINADRTGSARVHHVGQPRRRVFAGMVIAALVITALIASLVAAAGVALFGPPMVGIAVSCAVLIIAVTLLLSVVSQQGIPTSAISRLASGRPAAVLTDVLAVPQGKGIGGALMKQLQQRWDRPGAPIVVLHAGSDDLVAFYSRLGWSTWEGRRMVWGETASPGGCQEPLRSNKFRADDGSAGGFALIALVASIGLLLVFGLVVDGGTKAGALDRANRIAMEAAAAGAQVLTRQGSVDDTIQNYLAAEGVTGAVSVDGDRVNVSVNVSEPTKVLSMVGYTRINVTGTGFAYAIYRDAEG